MKRNLLIGIALVAIVFTLLFPVAHAKDQAPHPRDDLRTMQTSRPAPTPQTDLSAEHVKTSSVSGLLSAIAILAFVVSMMRVVGGIPTPQDASLVIQDTVTKTATFSSAGFDMGSGFAPGGIGMPVAAVIDVSARDFTTGDETYVAVIEESDDNAAWSACGATLSILATGVKMAKGVLAKRYVRVTLTLAGTTPSITYKIYLNTSMQR